MTSGSTVLSAALGPCHCAACGCVQLGGHAMERHAAACIWGPCHWVAHCCVQTGRGHAIGQHAAARGRAAKLRAEH
eukprot:110030-Chlamydomonas_euryale.AAC.1